MRTNHNPPSLCLFPELELPFSNPYVGLWPGHGLISNPRLRLTLRSVTLFHLTFRESCASILLARAGSELGGDIADARAAVH